MNKLFFIFFLISLFLTKTSFADSNDPIYSMNPPVVFDAGREPTATEPNIASIVPSGWTVTWQNHDINTNTYDCKFCVNGSMIWDQRVYTSNLAAIASSLNIISPLTKLYIGNTSKSNVKFLAKNAPIAGGAGQVIFYLTDNGLLGGNALFTQLYEDTISFEINNANISYRWSWILSPDKKTLTVTVNQSTSVTLLGIALLTAPSPAIDGTVVRFNVYGE